MFSSSLLAWAFVLTAAVSYRSDDIVRLPILLFLAFYAFTAKWGDQESFFANQVVYGLLTYFLVKVALHVIALVNFSRRNPS